MAGSDRDTNMSAFPERLQRLREQQHKSRVVLSELCGLSPDAIRRYERGEASPTLDAFVALADYFGVSLDYLAGREKFTKNS